MSNEELHKFQAVKSRSVTWMWNIPSTACETLIKY